MSIKFNNLESIKNTAYDTEKATFVDLTLDIDFNRKDLNVSFDELAIKNALYVLLNTFPGENILNPTLGINLQKNLFDQLTEANGYSIASSIRTAISKFEPRVKVEQIIVNILPDEQSYSVTILIRIPALKYRTKFTGVFNRNKQFVLRSE